MRIVLDAMGGDLAPGVTIAGAVGTARELPQVQIILVGREETIRQELAKHDTSGLSFPIVHASQVIEMADKPAIAVKAKPDSSMVVGVRMLKDGRGDAFVSMGNSGGVYAAALFQLGRIPGIRRPALSTIYPTKERPIFLLDMGANTDCKPEYLLQFALMGAAYVERALGIPRPRVGIVSTGEEEGKGSLLVLEAYELIKKSGLNFVGNLEGRDIPAGRADVVVTDGFTGNVIIKLSEGIGGLLSELIEEEIKSQPISALGGLLAKPAFARVKRRLDYSEYGGAPLLGVNGVVIIGHGRSNAKAVKNAIRVAARAVEQQVVAAIREGVAAGASTAEEPDRGEELDADAILAGGEGKGA